VEETKRLLKPVFPAAAVHAGKPPSTWLTAPINVALPLARSLWPRLRTSRLEGHVAAEDDPQPTEKLTGFSGLVYAIRSVTLAWDRKQLLVRAARQAAAGEIIISDQALERAGIDSRGLEQRSLELKGITGRVCVRVMHAA
jgi:hypothetical protein